MIDVRSLHMHCIEIEATQEKNYFSHMSELLSHNVNTAMLAARRRLESEQMQKKKKKKMRVATPP